MTTKEKRVFINELIKNVKEEILSKVNTMPDDWEGIELRWYIADKFSDTIMNTMSSKARKLEYNNTIMVTNL
jgi:hypothetical protein